MQGRKNGRRAWPCGGAGPARACDGRRKMPRRALLKGLRGPARACEGLRGPGRGAAQIAPFVRPWCVRALPQRCALARCAVINWSQSVGDEARDLIAKEAARPSDGGHPLKSPFISEVHGCAVPHWRYRSQRIMMP